MFGRGISDTFMLPYNCKLFCRRPADMTADWVSWAVPKPTLREVVDGALELVTSNRLVETVDYTVVLGGFVGSAGDTLRFGGTIPAAAGDGKRYRLHDRGQYGR